MRILKAKKADWIDRFAETLEKNEIIDKFEPKEVV